MQHFAHHLPQRKCKRPAQSNGITASEAPAPRTTPRSTRPEPKCDQVCRNSLMPHHYGARIPRTQRCVRCLILQKRRRHNALTAQPRPARHFHQVCWTLRLSPPKRLRHPKRAKIPWKPCLRPPHQSQMLKKRALQIRCRPLRKHARS